ncbi:MAG: hypothetical protein U9O90_11705, partial [Euryarchaeota archaeon]|nr:hypothetical protein [Euryarchaeota archaeon]
MKTKMKGKAIKGIIIAAIMIASILVATVPMAVATSDGTDFNTISGPATQKVLTGQNLQFEGFRGAVTVSRIVSGDVENVYQTDANNRIYNVNWPTTGAFFVNYNASAKRGEAQLGVEEPDVPLKLKVGTKQVASIAEGTDLKVYTGGINLFEEDLVDLVIIGSDGQIKTDTINNQKFTSISVAQLMAYGDKLITNGWKIGDYTFQVKSKSANACGLDVKSDVKPLRILKGEISIDAEPTSTMELDTVTVTVTGVAGDEIRVAADPCDGATFKDGVDDTPTNAECTFTDTIDADG